MSGEHQVCVRRKSNLNLSLTLVDVKLVIFYGGIHETFKLKSSFTCNKLDNLLILAHCKLTISDMQSINQDMLYKLLFTPDLVFNNSVI